MCYKFIRIFICLFICISLNYIFPVGAMSEKSNDRYSPENLRGSQRQPATMDYVDAYGNSIFEEIEKKPKKKRISAGAYGGYGATKEKEVRPLPEMPAEPKWSFK